MARADEQMFPTPLVRLAPIGLLVLAQIAGWLAVERLVPQSSLMISVPPTLLLVVIRLVLMRCGERWINHPVMKIGFVVHTVLVVIASAYNPFTAIYTFMGYLDSGRWFTGRWMTAVVVTTGLLSAFGQSGGLASLLAVPSIFFALAVVNILISTLMVRFEHVREASVRERERVADELAAAHAQNLALHEQLMGRATEDGIAQERARLSREIHDTIAQGLVGVIRQLEAIPDEQLDPDARLRVTAADTAARDCLDETRRAVSALAPRQLQDHGLADAVREELTSWSGRTGVPGDLVVDGRSGPPSSGDTVVLRVVQESLSNVARHGGDCTVTVSLSFLPELIMVDVYDDGHGFDHDQVHRQAGSRLGGHGLAGMRSRVIEAGGEFTVESRPGAGCTISAAVPRGATPNDERSELISALEKETTSRERTTA